MSEQEIVQPTENKPSDKELNFRALEARYQRDLEREKASRLEAERLIQELQSNKDKHEEEDDSNPYVDLKKLDRRFHSFERKMEETIDKRAEEKARLFVERQENENWVRQNPDFYQVLQHVEEFAQRDPELAASILAMPEGFERQKLVYRNIKALGLDKPQPKQPSIQEKIDANRRSPYYQPSGMGSPPYASSGDFSPSGQKNAYDKMKELQNRLRL